MATDGEVAVSSALTYRLRSLGDSSERHGLCEVHGCYCEEVFVQTRWNEYEPGKFVEVPPAAFGCKACLIGLREAESD